jgi:hypothetical protein
MSPYFIFKTNIGQAKGMTHPRKGSLIRKLRR